MIRVEVEVSLLGRGAERVEVRVEHVHDVFGGVAHNGALLLVPQHGHRERAFVICVQITSGNASVKI